MAYRILRNAGAISEFVAGFTGDCGETAELTSLHPAIGLPLDAATLRAVVGRSQAINASANGSEPLSTIDRDLANIHVPHTVYAYAEPFGVDWQAIAAQSAGIRPIIVEVSHAGALPGDESGVHYHFVTIVGLDGAVLIVADGDNTAARSGQLVRYTVDQLAAAGVCGLITVDVDCQDMSATGGSAAVADNTAGLGSGILGYVQAHGISGQSLIPGGEADLYPGNHNGERIAAFAPNDVVYWDGSAVKEHVDAYVVAGLHAAQATLSEQVQSLLAQLAQANQQNATLQTQVQNLMAQVAQLKQQPPAPSQPAPAQPSDAVTTAITNLVDVIASEILKGKVA